MKRDGVIIAALLAVIIAGAAFRAWPIASRPLWFDEASDWLSSSRTADKVMRGHDLAYSDFFRWTHDFEAAPFMFLIRRVAMDVTGSEAEWVQRLPAVLTAIACIPVAFWLGRVVHSKLLGLILAAFMAFDPSMVDLGQQSRSYPMLMFLALLAMILAIKLLRPQPPPLSSPAGFDETTHSRHAPSFFLYPVLGIILGLAFCTTQFALALWFGVGLAAVALLAVGIKLRIPGISPVRVILGLTTAYIVAAVIGLPGIINLFTKDAGRGWGAHLTYSEIAKEIATSAKDIISPSPAGLIVYLLAAVGLVLLFKRCKTSTAVLVCVALGNVIMLFPFRKTHHFMAPRYLTLIQPAVWVGLGMLAVALPAVWPRRVGIAAVVAVLALNLYFSIRQDAWFTGPDTGKWLVGPQIVKLSDHVRDHEPTAAVVYQPQIMEKVGRYYRLPIDPDLDAGLYENYQDRKDPKVPDAFTAPVTYLVIAGVADPTRLEKARAVIDALASHYKVDPRHPLRDRNLQKYRVVIVRFSSKGVDFQSQGVGEPDTIHFAE